MDLELEAQCGESSGGAPREPDGEADVVVETPVLQVGELQVKATKLKAHLAVHAQIAGVVPLEIGPNVDLGDAELHLREVETRGRLRVGLEQVYDILELSFSAIDRHPQLLQLIASRPANTNARIRQLGEIVSGTVLEALALPLLVLRTTRELGGRLYRAGRQRSE